MTLQNGETTGLLGSSEYEPDTFLRFPPDAQITKIIVYTISNQVVEFTNIWGIQIKCRDKKHNQEFMAEEVDWDNMHTKKYAH